MPLPIRPLIRRPWLLPGLLAVVAGAAGAGWLDSGPQPLPYPVPAPGRPARWQQDINYLSANLERLHPALYTNVAPATWQAAVVRLKGQAATCSDAELALGVGQLLALLHDDHTHLAQDTAAAVCPVNFRWFPGGVYATQGRGPGRALFGARLLAVGGVPTAQALVRLGTLVSASNEVGRLTGATRLLSSAGALRYCGLAGPDSVRYTWQPAGGPPRREALAARPAVAWAANIPLLGVPGVAMPLYRQHAAEPFWQQALPAQQALYVQYNACREAGRFLRFSWAVRQQALATHATRLVLDLRFNGGGSSRQFRPLRWWLAHTAPYNQPGHLFVIIGRSTASSGLRAACELKQDHAVLVGEATGSCPTAHFTEVKSFRLPNSRLEIQYASEPSNYLPELGTAPALLPDQPAPLTIQDFLAGRDPALAAALGRPSK